MATRLEKAATLPSQAVPNSFRHAKTLNKPPPPVPGSGTTRTVTLDAADQERYDLWVIARENGTLSGYEQLNCSPALQAAMAEFEAYLTDPAYQNWAAVDEASRAAQWRLFLIDVGEAVNAKGTVPGSDDSTGEGSNPISPGEVGEIGGEVEPIAGELVTTGGDTSELVFGDDGDTVTVAGGGPAGGGGAGTGGAVSSVFGRAGAVIAADGDYTFAQIAGKPTTLAGYAGLRTLCLRQERLRQLLIRLTSGQRRDW